MISFFKRNSPVIRERAAHGISRANIDPDALKVLYRLANTGYTAYLVGGSVRDLLLGRQPKDFDIGTDARPNEIRRQFRNCFLIGRRFRLAHIVFGRKVIETSTFRRQPEATESENGLYQTEDNTFGSPEEDAKRRDFTVNGLFYDIKTFSVIDYVGGLKDLEKRLLRCIGDPTIRFREDPVRMMRAVKFAARLGFTIDRASCKAILKYHADILNASVPRVCEEIFRLFTFGSARAAFLMLWEFNLLDDLLPELGAYIDASGGKRSPLWNYLAALDVDPANAALSNGVRLACLYYPLFFEMLRQEERRYPNSRVNRQHVARQALHAVAQRLHIPKATLYTAQALMDVPRRFADSPAKGRGHRFLFHPGFPEALAFQRILLTAEKADLSCLNEWQALYEQHTAQNAPRQPRPEQADVPEGAEMPRDAEEDESDRPRRRSRRRRPRRGTAGHEPGGEPHGVTVTEAS
ncbi:MAG TPA: polynucleotide adenylyltransferase PcnB [Kiritimatiellia bacterium]|jgi:poly(A) polymerase|nr:MAG: Poly(A) polymerase I precursor [Verrucomicrobia bacterium ADurb.Bin070]HPB10219.1 polynucleotide adenylyltransferase PcnB [Kiritimatiellia bacterium]HPO36461.1 polynucleotide adenylyltransferase PcnB [Kiritimatiellia bacterium]HQL50700.1 polynucleotide adenylyltransferase PcnB [Kiritimatiellia bacterium]HQQ91258.1 polynucleotide adenylyltransferase PcnB [Kiritimatiellia bacterium]